MAGDVVTSMWGENGPVKQSIYEESSAAKHRFGARAVTGDGRVFRYCKNGAVALTPGKLLQGAPPVAGDTVHLNCLVAAAVVAGAKKISVAMGASAAAANYYAEGFLHCNDVSPEGNYYKIKSHLAIAGSDTVWFNLYDPVIKALSVTSQVSFTKNAYDGVVIAPNAALTQAAIGVSIIDVTASYYFWAQTWGDCAVLGQGTLVIGQNAGLGGTNDGAVGPVSADTTAIVGWVRRVNVSTEYSLIALRIAP